MHWFCRPFCFKYFSLSSDQSINVILLIYGFHHSIDNTIKGTMLFWRNGFSFGIAPLRSQYDSIPRASRRAAKQHRFLTKSLTHSEKIFLIVKSRNAEILSYFKWRENIIRLIFRYGKHRTLIVLSGLSDIRNRICRYGYFAVCRKTVENHIDAF